MYGLQDVPTVRSSQHSQPPYQEANAHTFLPSLCAPETGKRDHVHRKGLQVSVTAHGIGGRWGEEVKSVDGVECASRLPIVFGCLVLFTYVTWYPVGRGYQ